jgi:3-oxoacyl-[acyl-carrier protein] reductase
MNILITGGSRGIGFEIVKLLSPNNNITVLSRTIGKLKELENINWIKFDLVNDTNYINLKNILDIEFDILINNAGGGAHSKIQNISIKKMDEAINLNLKQVIWITHLVSKKMIRNKKGLIINIASIHALRGNQNSSLYSATKFALRGFSESIYYELKKHNIKVTTVYPDLTNTTLLPKGIKGREKMIQPHSIAILIKNIIELPQELIVKDITISY